MKLLGEANILARDVPATKVFELSKIGAFDKLEGMCINWPNQANDLKIKWMNY